MIVIVHDLKNNSCFTFLSSPSEPAVSFINAFIFYHSFLDEISRLWKRF